MGLPAVPCRSERLRSLVRKQAWHECHMPGLSALQILELMLCFSSLWSPTQTAGCLGFALWLEHFTSRPGQLAPCLYLRTAAALAKLHVAT